MNQKFLKYVAYRVRKDQLTKRAGSATLWSQMNVFDEIKKCDKWINHLKDYGDTLKSTSG